MGGRLLSILAGAAVIAVAAAAAVDSLRGDEPRVAAIEQPRDCLDGGPCLRNLRQLVDFYRGCVRSWNHSANRSGQVFVAEGGFDSATLFRSTGGRCSLYFISGASGRILLARRVDGEWSEVGGGRRPPAADDFTNSLPVGVRPDGTLSLRDG